MPCPDCQALEAKILELEERLEQYSGRGAEIQDLLASKIMDGLRDDPSANFLSVARQFLRDNGICDIRTGDTPTNHLAENYPFPADDFEVKEPNLA